MQAIEYKGFNIIHYEYTNPSADRFYVTVGTHETVEGFNPEGYATLNNAKGAITKHLKARDAQHDKGMEVLAEQSAEKAKADAAVDERVDYLVGLIGIPVQRVNTPAKHMSRNKREGVFVGRSDGKVDRWAVNAPYNVASFSMRPRTRKQKKLAEINFKNKQK